MIGIRELLEQLALDCFNNHFSNDTRTSANNLPHLDEVNDGETVSNCHAINFSSSTSRPQRSSLFYTSHSTVLHCQPLLWWILLLNLSILLKNKELGREGCITGLLEVTLITGYQMEINASR